MKGPVQSEMEKRLEAALRPESLAVINNSQLHLGHAGYDGSGESHFLIEITASIFKDMNRVERQRAVNKALGDLTASVHAIAIKAKSPGE